MRVQLMIAIIFIGIVPMFILSRVLVSSYENHAITQRTSILQYHGTVIANSLLASGYFSGVENIEIDSTNQEINQVAENYEGRILIVDNRLCIRKDTYGLEEGKTIISEEAITTLRGTSCSYIDKEHQYLEITTPVVNTVDKEIIGAIIMSFSIKNIREIYLVIAQKAMVFIVILAILVVLFSAFYSDLLTKPFKRMSKSIDHMSEGYLNERVNMRGFTEIEGISNSFNELLNRLQKLEDSRQEFVSNVSHELKTPITSIKVLSDSLLTQEDVPAELYREFMVDIVDEIERENKIINDLLSLVKLDKKVGELNISSVNINELLEVILKRLRPIAEKRNIELVFESFRPVLAEVDEVKLSLAINNLIENAIKYNFDDGWVRVSLNADHKFFYVKVSDSGVGIPEEEQDNIFERFYRVDKARSRETGGTGLGLSITRNAILMHRGAIKVYSKEKEGTTFTVRIPLSYIA